MKSHISRNSQNQRFSPRNSLSCVLFWVNPSPNPQSHTNKFNEIKLPPSFPQPSQPKISPPSSFFVLLKEEGRKMVSSSSSLLLFLFHFLIFFSSSNSLPDSVADSPTQPSNGTTVYELLPKYGLPSGLLPDSVTSFSLSDSGDFVVELQKPCYLQFEYLVYYDRRITGTLMYGGIKNLKGIEVKKFFLWLNVDEIMVDLPPSDFIYFHVGWITKKLDISQFRRVRSCGDGVCMSVLQVPEGNSMSILQVPAQTRKIPMLFAE